MFTEEREADIVKKIRLSDNTDIPSARKALPNRSFMLYNQT